MHSKAFFEEVGRLLACDMRRAEALSTVVLQELHQRLTPEEARHVAAQLPKDLRLVWDEATALLESGIRVHRSELIGRVRKRAVLGDDLEAERAVRAVFHTLQHALGSPTGTDGESGDIYDQLPKDLKVLWTESARFAPPADQV